MSARLMTLLLFLACLTPTPSAQVLDAVMRPGDRFLGELDGPEDVDLVRFQSVAGAELTVVVTPAKSKVRPSITLIDLSDDSSVLTAVPAKPNSGKIVVKGQVLPTTGGYTIQISGIEGSTGSYQLKLVEKLPKALAKTKLEQLVTSGDDLELSFEAAKGMQIDARISKGKKSDANPLPPVLAGPGGALPLGEALESKLKPKGDSHRVRQLALETSGAYTLASENGAEEDGALKATFVLRRQKLPKRTLEELPSGDAETTSLAGSVLASTDKLGLQGADVLINGQTVASTDASGNFLIQDPPAGPVQLVIDGSNVVNGPVGASFGSLTVDTVVSGEGGSQLAQAVVLPDVASVQTASGTATVDSQTGVTTAPLAASPVDPASKVGLTAEAGIEISVDGAPVAADLLLSVTPVAPEDVPAPLAPEGLDLDASSYVTVSPVNAAFRKQSLDAVPGEQGLDAVFENDRDLPVGTLVDIWAFDATTGAWVNRSSQTGVQGVVVDNGDGSTQIEVQGAVLSGGFYAPVVAVEANCATVVRGRVVADGTGLPIAGAAVATTLGQFATTASDGSFEIRAVPAYVFGDLPGCSVLDDGLGRAFDVVVLTPVSHGALRVVRSVGTSEVVTGGATELGDISAAVPTLGSLVVQVQDNGSPVAGAAVSLEGPEVTTQHTTGANGQFFVAGLEPGSYIASHSFVGDSEATSVTFEIKANKTTTVNLQRTGGAGKKDVTIQVVTLSGEGPALVVAPLSGAKVKLVTKDTPAGVQGTTNANGKVTFEQVDPPYTVTAQVDRVVPDGEGTIVGRFATTVYDVTPKSGVVSVPIELDGDDGEGQVADASLFGVVANLPQSQDPGDVFTTLEVAVYDSVTGASLTEFLGPGDVDPYSGEWSVSYTSTGNPLHLVFREQQELLFGDPEEDFAEADVTVAVQVLLGLADNGPESETLVEGFDYALAIPLEPVALSLHNLPGVIDEQHWGTTLVLEDGAPLPLSRVDVFNQFEDEPIVPELFWVPDLSHADLVDQQVLATALVLQTGDEDSLDPGIGLGPFIERASEISLRLDGLDLSAGLDLSFGEDFVRVLQPSPNDEVFSDDTDDLTAVIDDRTEGGVQGYNLLMLEGQDLPEDFPVQFIHWAVYSRLGEDSVPLPPTSLPLFGLYGVYEVELETVTTSGSPLTYARFFDQDFELHLRELLSPVVPLRIDSISQLFEVLED